MLERKEIQMMALPSIIPFLEVKNQDRPKRKNSVA